MSNTFTVDLNCDMGESFGAFHLGNDVALMALITSANIACGFHAGDPSVMKSTVRLALKHGVAIGAHPGLPDLQGFGRREMSVSADEVYDLTIYQIGALAAFVKSEGGTLHHVKPHGALYNLAASNAKLADAVAEAICRIDAGLLLYGLSGSELISAGQRLGLGVVNEVFADRSYEPDGSLTARTQPGAVITDVQVAVDQVLCMVKEGFVKTKSQTQVPIQADTICLHGDNVHAPGFATMIRENLLRQGVQLQAPKQLNG
jgi:UPF0271 protein